MLQYTQIEEILGKRPEGLFPVQVEEEYLPENNTESSREIVSQNNMDQLSQKEQAELEEAVAKLREGRNLPEN
jgi:cell division protease FtsH